MLCTFLLIFYLSASSPPNTSPKTSREVSMERQGLVDLQSVAPDIFVHLMYAHPDNFVGRTLYTDLHRAYLLPETARALTKAQAALQQVHPEFSLIVYDATRPMSIQRQMWKAVAGTRRSIYVSNPAHGGGLHNYGLAVDLTLCWSKDILDKTGKIVHSRGDTTGISMGTPIDYLGELAHVKDESRWIREKKLTQEQLRHRIILRKAMEAGGFKVLPTEWWHFNFKSRTEARARYKVIR